MRGGVPKGRVEIRVRKGTIRSMRPIEIILLVVIAVIALSIFVFLVSAWLFSLRDVLVRQDQDILVRLIWAGVIICMPVIGTLVYLAFGRPDAGARFINDWMQLPARMRRIRPSSI